MVAAETKSDACIGATQAGRALVWVFWEVVVLTVYVSITSGRLYDPSAQLTLLDQLQEISAEQDKRFRYVLLSLFLTSLLALVCFYYSSMPTGHPIPLTGAMHESERWCYLPFKFPG